MSKPIAFVLLTLCAVVAAGVFGMLHNQLSYSVGASYFHDFKFDQFGIPAEAQGRWGAAVVGWRASWWMGLLVGLPAFVLGYLWIGRPKLLLTAGLGAIGAVISLALLAAMGGLLLGMARSTGALEGLVALPTSVSDPQGFIRAALMHNGTYLGGLAGVLVAVLTMWRMRGMERALKRAAG